MTLPITAYSANENQVLIDHWHTPTTFKEMSRLLDGRRTLGSIKNQGYTMLKLGKRREGSNLGKPVYERLVLTPWPDGVRFEDHENAPPPGSRANAIKAAQRYAHD